MAVFYRVSEFNDFPMPDTVGQAFADIISLLVQAKELILRSLTNRQFPD